MAIHKRDMAGMAHIAEGRRKQEPKSGSSNHEIHPAHTKAEPGNSTYPLNTLSNANRGKQIYQNEPPPGM